VSEIKQHLTLIEASLIVVLENQLSILNEFSGPDVSMTLDIQGRRKASKETIRQLRHESYIADRADAGAKDGAK
jgi:hypothetical protein